MPGLTGCTLVAFGQRIIESPQILYNNTLDKQMFVYVELSHQWRKSLTTHKDKVKNDREDLMIAIWNEVEGLAESLRKMKREIKMELMLEGLSEEFEKAFKVLEEPGEHDVDDDTRVPGEEGGGGGGRGSVPGGTRKPGTRKLHQVRKKKDVNVSFKLQTGTDESVEGVANSSCQVSGGDVMIKVIINTDHPAVEYVFNNKGHGLNILVSDSLAHLLLSNDGAEVARKLFGNTMPNDESYGATEKIGKFSGLLLGRLKVPEEVTDADVKLGAIGGGSPPPFFLRQMPLFLETPMTYELRETPEEIQRKEADLALFADHTGSTPRALFEQKYKLDAVMTREDDIVAWVEHKSSTNTYGCILNASKAAAGVEHARTSKRPFILVARHEDRLYWVAVFDIKSKTNWQNILHHDDVKLVWIEDNREGHDNPDDTEPCYVIPWQLFHEVKV